MSEIAESRGIVYQFDDHHPRGIIREARYLTQHLWEKKNKPLKWNFNKDSNIRALQQGFKTGLVQELALDEKVLVLFCLLSRLLEFRLTERWIECGAICESEVEGCKV